MTTWATLCGARSATAATSGSVAFQDAIDRLKAAIAYLEYHAANPGQPYPPRWQRKAIRNELREKQSGCCAICGQSGK
jgi:hypothetical protein